jgi:hypothetical protein
MSLYRDRFVVNYLGMALRTSEEPTALEDGLAANFNFTCSKCYKCRFITVSLLLTTLVLIGVAFRFCRKVKCSVL